MAATITTQEPFEKSITREQLDEEVRLRIKAGAIKSWVEEKADKWILNTEWNVIGEQ